MIFKAYLVPHFSVSSKETETQLGTRWFAKFAIQSERIVSMSMSFVFSAFGCAVSGRSAARLWHGRWQGEGGWSLRFGSFDATTAGIAWFCKKGRKAQTHYAHGFEQTGRNSFEDKPPSILVHTHDSRRSCTCPQIFCTEFAF